MLKLTIDSRMINSSGVGRYLTNTLIGLLQSNEFDITLLVNGDKDLTSLSNYNYFSVINFPYEVFDYKEQFYYPKYINECDIYWAPFFNVPLRPINAKKVVTSLYDVFHLASTNHVSLLQRIYAKLLINRAINISDKIITISDFSVSEILLHTNLKDTNKLQMIYCGAPEVILQNTNKESEKFFLFVGNIKPHKNLINAIKGFDLFINNNEILSSSFKFKIIGKKDGFITSDNKLIDLIESNKLLKEKVIFTGRVTDEELVDYYRRAYAFIFPSLYEGFGLPPLESMAYGCPVIASNYASIPEVCGDSVMYFNPLDPSDIASKMLYLSNNAALRNDLIEKGYKRAKEFSWDQSNELHIKLFKNLST